MLVIFFSITCLVIGIWPPPSKSKAAQRCIGLQRQLNTCAKLADNSGLCIYHFSVTKILTVLVLKRTTLMTATTIRTIDWSSGSYTKFEGVGCYNSGM